MKIGILTLPLHFNYGGILQAYALQTALKRLGHDAYLIVEKKRIGPPKWKIPFSFCKRSLLALIHRDKKRMIPYEKKIKAELATRGKNLNPFIEKYITPQAPIYKLSALKKYKFDGIVVGSDQIWRPKYYKEIENAYLHFAQKWRIIRFSYAASFGTEEWEYTESQTQNCKLLLEKFQAISVREDSGVKLCMEHFNRKASWVLDPTLLLYKSDYLNIIKQFNFNSHKEKERKILFSYILDNSPEKENELVSFAENIGYDFHKISLVEDSSAPIEKRTPVAIEEWLYNFYNADLIITNSFHGCIFSIIFNKQFFVIGNKDRGMTRFKSLLSLLNLEDQFVDSFEEISLKNIKVDIDWNRINQILDEKRNFSISYLKEALIYE